MCGIAGIWGDGLNQPLEQLVDRMAAQIAHRGPDDSGRWVDTAHHIALGHRRLAIQDLSAAGHQPMASVSGRFMLVLNGEIYNHPELRKELEAAAGQIAWRGHSDTETLLAMCERFGLETTLRRCVGMFAIALWDRERGCLMLARDRIGEKPLYFGCVGSTLLFASELKAIRAVLGDRCEIDREALTLYMRHNYVPAPRTIYRNVSKLEPGTIATFTARGAVPQVTTYWNAREVALAGMQHPFEDSDEAAVDRLNAVLGQAVQAQLISDVPLGAFLSGGIDSSLIAALMQVKGRARAKTFTIGFHEKQFDEARYAREVARHLGTEHTEHIVTPQEALSVIPALPQMYDEPFADSSQIPTFLVSRLARQKVTVSLSGDAGDELFGGYARYLWTRRIARSLALVPRGLRKPIVRLLRARGTNPSAAAIAAGSAGAPIPRFVRLREQVDKVLDLIDVNSPTELYHGLLSHWKDPASVIVGGSEPATRVTDPTAWLGQGGIESHMMYLDLVTYLPDDILVKVDRASMSVALESRVPLLDHRVVEFAWSLPMRFKIREGRGKWIMRKLLERYVPRELFEREKTGFGIPIDSWLRGPLRDWAEALLDPRRLTEEGFFEVTPIRARWEQHKAGTRSWGYLLWDVLMFQAWWEHCRASRIHSDSRMNNYEYCTQFVVTRLPAVGAKVLDYGCGGGTIVSQCRSLGIDAYGCDAFYEGGDYSPSVPADLLGTVIRRMEGDQIPFEENTFDCVVNNQVLEHVPDLDVVVREIRRVLKPGGFVLSMFPDRGVWREGHCGIPFLHRFPKGSRARVWYAAFMRSLGLGYHKKGKSARQWSEDFCHWLDAWTHYRSYEAIRTSFARQFARIDHYEDDWLAKRLADRAGLARPVPVWARRWFVRKMMGLVFVATV